MRVFGYKDNKDMVDIDLPIEEIVANEIDPWRLDLYDPEPLTYQKGELQVNFRRLRDLAFVYLSDDRLFLCMDDGTRKVSVWSDQYEIPSPGLSDWDYVAHHYPTRTPCFPYGARWLGPEHTYRQGRRKLVLHNVRPSEHTYEQHLQDYLSALYGDNQKNSSRQIFYAPQTAGQVSVNGKSLTFSQSSRESLESHSYTTLQGELFVERVIPCPVSPVLGWVFDKFKPLNPVVTGKAVWDLLAGRHPTEVEILHGQMNSMQAATWLLDHADSLDIEESKTIVTNSRLAGKSLLFRRMGIRFFLATDPTPAGTIAQSLRNPNDFRFSTDGLYCKRPEEVCGTRLAFFDVGNGQTRAISPSAMQESFTPPELAGTKPYPEGYEVFRTTPYVDEDEIEAAALHAQSGFRVLRPEMIRPRR